MTLANAVAVIGTATDTVMGTVPLPGDLLGIAITPF